MYFNVIKYYLWVVGVILIRVHIGRNPWRRPIFLTCMGAEASIPDN